MARGIVVDPAVCCGKPVLEGTRIPVHMVLELLEQGIDYKTITQDYYPELEEADVRSCIAYANRLVKNEDVFFEAEPAPK